MGDTTEEEEEAVASTSPSEGSRTSFRRVSAILILLSFLLSIGWISMLLVAPQPPSVNVPISNQDYGKNHEAGEDGGMCYLPILKYVCFIASFQFLLRLGPIWGPWSAPSVCSATCGGGERFLHRACKEKVSNGGHAFKWNSYICR